MSQYLEALRQAMVIYPMIVVLFTVPYIAWSYHKYGSVLSLRVLIVYSFLLYLLCVYCLVILPLPTPEKAATLHGHKEFPIVKDTTPNITNSRLNNIP